MIMIKRKHFSRVDWQVTILLGIVLFLFSTSLYVISIKIYHGATLNTLTHRVNTIHNYIEHHLTADGFLEINTKEDMAKDSYQTLKKTLENVRELCDLQYLYTAKKAPNGSLVYVVDGLSENAEDFRYPGDLIEPEIQQELLSALNGDVILPDKILDTDWGNIFIAYYPLHDDNGTVVGALGIEIPADIEAAAAKKLSQAAFLSSLFFCMITFVASLFIFRRISNPLYRDMANTDFMTKLKNRNSYETDRDNWIARKPLSALTVAVIDLNNLKLANDSLGHDIGDNCIMNAAKILRKLENHNITAYRYGGDEFILLMENITDPEDIITKAKEDFRKTVSHLAVPLALAIGYAHFDPILDSTILDTQKRADENMYQDKLKIKASEQHADS